jgi:hypothetical protein
VPTAGDNLHERDNSGHFGLRIAILVAGAVLVALVDAGVSVDIGLVGVGLFFVGSGAVLFFRQLALRNARAMNARSDHTTAGDARPAGRVRLESWLAALTVIGGAALITFAAVR